MDASEYLKSILYTKDEVDHWLSGKKFPFAKYHSEFGWLLRDGKFRDGINNSISVYTYGQYDERKMINYKRKLCRINTYGNSFTQCHQVSDGETWQEILAAHLHEPIRNFGVGGWSVYQAYLRMKKEEKRTPADYIIFNIYEDDHYRNLDAWRNIRAKKHEQFIEPTLPHVKVNEQEQSFQECSNPCSTPESVYNLCDLNYVCQLFNDNFVLKIMLAHINSKENNPSPNNYNEIINLATTHGIKTKIDNSENLDKVADNLFTKSAMYSSQCIVKKIDKLAKENNKKVLYVLSYPPHSIAKYINEAKRSDQSFVDFLKIQNFPFIDLLEAHVNEYNQFKIGIKKYLERYFIGHYNPLGNFFCAFAIKNKLVEMLNPKPEPYQ